jgi:hypothetical protein
MSSSLQPLTPRAIAIASTAAAADDVKLYLFACLMIVSPRYSVLSDI